MLKITDLKANIDGKEILKGINLEVKPGEVHAIMGPNGSGKSTLASVLAGRSEYEITGGKVEFLGKDLLDMSPEDRAREGVFLAFQYPVEIPGVSTTNFLKTAVNEVRKYRGQEPLDAVSFLNLMKEKSKLVEIDPALLKRSLNEGFSGGEKKRNEVFQMAMLEPLLSILDETDSGLDIDALRIVSNGVNKLNSKDKAVIVVTHYQRLLTYIVPANQYDLQMKDGKATKLIDPASYHSIESNPVNPWKMVLAIPLGMREVANIIFFIFIVGGAFNIIQSTGAVESGIRAMVNGLRGKRGTGSATKDGILIFAIVTLFAVGGTTFGMAEEALVFIPMLVPLAVAMGYDSIVGLALALVGPCAGFTGAFLNPFTVGVAQGFVGLPIFSGMSYRVVIFCITTLVAFLFIFL